MKDSQHLLGNAADISCAGVSTKELYAAAEKLPVFQLGGMGLYTAFVHLDTRGVMARW